MPRILKLCVLVGTVAVIVAWLVWEYDTKGVSPPLPVVGEGWVTNLKGIENLADNSRQKVSKISKIMSLTGHEEAGGFLSGEGTILYAGGQRTSTHIRWCDYWTNGSPWGDPIGPKELMDQIRAQLRKLPASCVREPIKERKLVVHRFEEDRISAFGYDLANLPPEVRELLSLSKVHYPAWTLQIPADGSWQANKHAEGTLVAMRTTNKLLTCARGEPLRLWDAGTHELLQAIGCPQATKMAINADETFLAMMDLGHCHILDGQSWEVAHVIRQHGPHAFNGAKWLPGLLWLKNGAPSSGFFDATTWEPAPAPVGFPEFTKDFATIGENNYLVLSRDGKLSMVKDGKCSFEFPEVVVTQFSAATTADASLTAVAFRFGPTHRLSRLRILIVESDSGKLVRELLPFDLPSESQSSPQYAPMSLFWSRDGAYVLGDLANGQIAVWTTKNGRHRATLGEHRGESAVNSTIISPDQSTLYQYLKNGQIHYWKMDATLSKVLAFEAALEGATVNPVKPPQQ
jgi:hypothetical protein